MQLKRHTKAALAALAAVALSASTALAQIPPGMITSFEPAGPTEVTYPIGYTAGSVFLQDNWAGGDRFPSIATSEFIANELTTAGLNVGQPVHTGNQALLAVKLDTNAEVSPPGGYLVRNSFAGLESTNQVTASWWARPLTSGLGADPAGTPAGNGKLIGERQGNTFVGIMDGTEKRAIALRFGVDTVGSNPYTNVTERHIDWASASTGNINAPWVKTGILWEADEWYNFRFDMDFSTRKFDFFINGAKINDTPIQFYDEAATSAVKFFVSRGTNQAGQIIDDVSITPLLPPPTLLGDFDLDGMVDGQDFLAWQRNPSVGSLDDWKSNFGAGGAVSAASAIPEPSALALAGVATLGLGVRGRSRRSA